MNLTRRQMVHGGSSALLALGITGCGYLIHPERNGRTGGPVDVPILIVDLIWLLPGVIPGVICLAVDFSSGCIYRSGSSRAKSPTPNGTHPPPADAFVTLDNEVVARTPVFPDRSASLSWTRSLDEHVLRTRGRLVIARSVDAIAYAPLSKLI